MDPVYTVTFIASSVKVISANGITEVVLSLTESEIRRIYETLEESWRPQASTTLTK